MRKATGPIPPGFRNFDLTLIPRRADKEVTADKVTVFVGARGFLHTWKPRGDRKWRSVGHRVCVESEAYASEIQGIGQDDSVFSRERPSLPLSREARILWIQPQAPLASQVKRVAAGTGE